jgi:hypothetical protein
LSGNVLSWQEFVGRGYLAELARVFNNPRAAHALLEDIGFDPGLMPAWGNDQPQDFWRVAAHEVEDGRVAGGLRALVRAAADRYLHNPIFNSPESSSTPVNERAASGPSIVVTGEGDVHPIVDGAREIADEQGVPDPVEPGYAYADNVELRLPEATPEQAQGVAAEIERGGLAERATAVVNAFRDYLLERLYVEGPDQGRFELSDIPASTRLKDVVRAVLGEYDDEIWPRDRSGQSRPAVMDRLEEDGSSTRLNPHETLHESGIRDGETVHVAPESIAGGLTYETISHSPFGASVDAYPPYRRSSFLEPTADEPSQLEQLEQFGIIKELAKVFNEEDRATQVLSAVSFPIDEMPPFDSVDSWGFWSSVCHEIESGLISSDLDTFLGIVAHRYQYNTVFSPWLKYQPSHAVWAKLTIFLCHASKDKDLVREIYEKLQKDRFRPWLDEKDLLPGQHWKAETMKAIQAADAIIVFLSKNSTSTTGFFQREIKHALEIYDEHPEGANPLIPARLEECDVPLRFRELHWVDLFKREGYNKLLKSLRARQVHLTSRKLED